jgi:hypothetical protein
MRYKNTGNRRVLREGCAKTHKYRIKNREAFVAQRTLSHLRVARAATPCIMLRDLSGEETHKVFITEVTQARISIV